MERSEKAERQSNGFDGGTSVDTDTLESFIVGMDATFPGHPREKWEADFAAMKAEEATRGENT